LGLNPAQFHLLMNLDAPQGSPMSELAEILACDASYITGLVDKLEDRGLVQRLPDPEDRRVKLIALTEAGAAARSDLMSRLSRPPPFIEALPVEDKRALRDIFLKASRSVQDPSISLDHP
jgi:DNA-binding MarR family transcriptional regulator